MTGKMSAIVPVLIIGAVMRVMMLISVFVIYFQSSVIHGIEEHSSPISTADAKRLVIFVTDGLRMDKCFGSKLDNGGLIQIIRHLTVIEGVWWGSFTKIFLLLLEVGRKIRLNWITWTVGKSRHSAHVCEGSKMFINTYNIKEEDFADTDLSRLDAWVLERFEEFINHSSVNLTNSSQLRQDKKIILNRYMFKVDHGMTDSHGSSVVEETSTPIVVWGAGIRQPIKVNNEMFPQTAEWDLANILAEYTKPADLTPLMASVIGIGIQGVVPIEFLAGSESHKAVILFSNEC
ncbi:hypothetical protein CHUAL_013427 [Chamberlinius hualienensis]